ncbi:MAG: hypothetical protein ACLFVJ_04095 [Persicimonas sp.]
MKQALIIILLAGWAVCLSGCDRNEPSAQQTEAAEESRPAASRFSRAHAERHGERQGRIVVFVAQELTQLDPRSERTKQAREARKLLDDIVSRETSEESP